ncbi:hypothetical protein [Caulobacter sp. D5]|uniref:hypothetical protein n=1 Tax=Caulobacter sp. D5 TaxID=357400 RepID=UPI001304832E|nr:hypothetical protein [Caulobacter sp. D5]
MQSVLRAAAPPIAASGGPIITNAQANQLENDIKDSAANLGARLNRDADALAGLAVFGARSAKSEAKKWERAWRSLEGLVSRSDAKSERMESQYALIAMRSGLYPDKDQGGLVELRVGDVWKYGTSANPEDRYSPIVLRALGLAMMVETIGTRPQVLTQERVQIIEYVQTHGRRPPGNPIYK